MTNFTGKVRPLDEYLASVERLSSKQAFVCDGGYLPAHEVTKVKEHILNVYNSVKSEHVFVEKNGLVFDAVPFETQPGVRDLADKSIPVAPDLTAGYDKGSEENHFQRIGNNFRDEMGNQISVPSGLVGMKRLTIEKISQFGSLSAYLRAGTPSGTGTDLLGEALHRHAVGRYSGTNYGISSKHSVHKVPINTDIGQGFALTQLWALSTTGSPAITQSVECCVQQFPVLYGPEPALVLFATRDSYVTAVRDFEFPLFVQTNNKWVLSVAVNPVSVIDGDQYYLQMATKKDGDKWWVYIGGETSDDAIGYYPTSYYAETSSTGLAVAATRCDVGGEVLAENRANVVFNAMGSGQLASAGWKKSAYVRDVKIYQTNGTTLIPTLSVLTPGARYTVQRNRYAAPWNETLWYGGPGGT